MADIRLFPPLLDASLPSAMGETIQIPFQHNPLVSYNDVSAFQIVIKTVQGKELLNIAVEKPTSNLINVLSIPVNDIPTINAGNNYKVSIAYVDNNNIIGYFSTAAIIRYSGQLSASIQLNNRCDQNGDRYIYGEFLHSDDPYEKVHTYRFTITQENGQVVLDTGDLIHNTTNDTQSTSSVDSLLFEYDFGDINNWGKYYVQYICTTVSGLVIHSASQSLLYLCPTTPPEMGEDDELPTLTVTTDIDNAINHIVAHIPNGIKGRYLLKRAEESQTRWKAIGRYIFAEPKEKEIGLDYEIESGKKYIYCLQQYGQMGAVSTLFAKTDLIETNFNDCFLYDGTRQLKVAYNPKISSFKATRLTNKTDTIGSKYPYIFSNGIVDYKEFPISGLLSYQSDPDELFVTLEELGLARLNGVRQQTNAQDNTYYYLNTNLEDVVINAERRFKLMVLDFLNSNKPKLFKSATEGNYIVQTLNASLTPNDTLGRMLHTFNCNAYEIADVDTYMLKNVQVEFSPFKSDAVEELKISDNGVVELTTEENGVTHSFALVRAIVQALPGCKAHIVTRDFKTNYVSEYDHYIGSTGQYYIEHNDNNSAIIDFKLYDENNQEFHNGTITYWRKEYIDLTSTSFDEIVPSYLEVQVLSNNLYTKGQSVTLNNVLDLKDFSVQNNNAAPVNVTFTTTIDGESVSQQIVIPAHSTYSWVMPVDSSTVQLVNDSSQNIHYEVVCLSQMGGNNG